LWRRLLELLLLRMRSKRVKEIEILGRATSQSADRR
jgi:hypothetical protein